MPINCFKCPKCNSIQEVITLSIKEPVTTPICVNCNTLMDKVLNNTFGFILKGKGWSKDGYSKSGK